MDIWAAITAFGGGFVGYILGYFSGIENGRRAVYEPLLFQLRSVGIHTDVPAESWAKMPADDACRLIGGLIRVRIAELEAARRPQEVIEP